MQHHVKKSRLSKVFNNSLPTQYPPNIDDIITKDLARETPGVRLARELVKANTHKRIETITSNNLTLLPLSLRMNKAEHRVKKHTIPENKLALSPAITVISGKRKTC